MGFVEALRNVFQNREERTIQNQKGPSFDKCLSMNYDWIFNRKNSGERFYFTEKRRFQRYQDGQDVFCYPMTSFPIRARILDASIGGLKIKVNDILKINTDIGVVLYSRGKSNHFLVKVLWESEKDGAYEYGVEFVKQKNDNREVLQYISCLKG